MCQRTKTNSTRRWKYGRTQVTLTTTYTICMHILMHKLNHKRTKHYDWGGGEWGEEGEDGGEEWWQGDRERSKQVMSFTVVLWCWQCHDDIIICHLSQVFLDQFNRVLFRFRRGLRAGLRFDTLLRIHLQVSGLTGRHLGGQSSGAANAGGGRWVNWMSCRSFILLFAIVLNDW